MSKSKRCQIEAQRCQEAGRNPTLSQQDKLGATQGEADWLVAQQMAEEEEYESFLRSKALRALNCGLSVAHDELNQRLFRWQRDVVKWALGKGRSALFAGCGLGKTPMQLDWARLVCSRTGGNVLILAPLAVAEQTLREGHKFDIPTHLCRTQADVRSGINITNYEMLEHFEARDFAGVVLDESSILKAHDGKTRKYITNCFAEMPYRLACTATPAPNDYMELGTHAEFLGVMTRAEMLSMFFVHDGGDTSKWRLKGHAREEFWKWVCSWAVMIEKPSNIGYSDEGYLLPPILRHQHTVRLEQQIEGLLFTPDRLSLEERRQVRRGSLSERVRLCAQLVNESLEQWLVWCDLNDESVALSEQIPDAVEVKGSDTREHKRDTALAFADGRLRVIVSKPSIFGYGMNWQNCRNVAFVGLSDSFEQIYQAERRCWRFGQTHPVHIHVITSEGDGPVVRNIERKEHEFQHMIEGMVEHMKSEMDRELHGSTREQVAYQCAIESGTGWTAHLGDSIEVLRAITPESIHFSVFSPPFSSLYTYSNSMRDMGNCKGIEEFTLHFGWLCELLHRVLMPGRLVAFHCMNLPLTKERDGVIGIRDFRGDLIRAMEKVGFVYHSEVCIWKDPVTAMQRTKAIGLLYKQLRKDSTLSRQGIPDYLCVFRKRGTNEDPVTKRAEEFPVYLWQRYASPVWMDIDPSDTLQRESAREEADERHIAPLQLQVIERAIRLWTNPDDLVLSPFMGIGSEGYQALRMGRRFVGIELKESYWKQAVANLRQAETAGKEQHSLFAEMQNSGPDYGPEEVHVTDNKPIA